MSVDLTPWLQALRAWQNSGHTESGWEDGPTVVWPLVVMLGLALLYAFLSFELQTTVAENAEVIVSVGGFFLVVYAFMLYLPLTSHTWQNPPVGFQTQLEQTFDISVKHSEVTLETRPNSAEILVFSDRLNASSNRCATRICRMTAPTTWSIRPRTARCITARCASMAIP